MSKGSRPRPYSVTQNQFSKNWDNIFKKDVTTPEECDIPVLENEEMWAQRVIDEHQSKENKK
jgi:hypothetical protein